MLFLQDNMFNETNFFTKVRRLVVGKEKNLMDDKIFHRLSLIAFFAWVGLGADCMSSSCYGPEEAFLALKEHVYLSLIVGFMTVATIFIISASYNQIIELFPTGGGGYLVASKLMSPNIGMISGCALLIDYVLTIAISIASGTDAIFSFFPPHFLHIKIWVSIIGVMILTLMNLRGVKESVTVLMPIFLTFVVTHLIAIGYALISHADNLHNVMSGVGHETSAMYSQVGFLGVIILLMKSYSMGAGTYTGIEAVSNGLSVLREPKVETGKKTMRYMAISLSILVLGLMMAYLLYQVQHVPGKTLNAVLFEKITADWGVTGKFFVFIILLSEAIILFVASQTGFIGGPGVIANMAVDRWFPTKFASLSDRLVTQNGIVLMGAAALITLVLTKGSVKFLVVLYSINVFITFSLSQLGMITHWWKCREKKWKRKLFINGTGFILCSFILVSMVAIKFNEGGWITLAVTGILAAFAIYIKRCYLKTMKQLHHLNSLIETTKTALINKSPQQQPAQCSPQAKTAVLFVNGYNGLGLHSLFHVMRLFGNEFKNYVFVQIGVIDAGNFKGERDVDTLRVHINKEVSHYVNVMQNEGYYAEGMIFLDTDVISALEQIGPAIIAKFPNSVFFGGQLVFSENTFINRMLHNHTVFAMQQKFYQEAIPFIILPIRIDLDADKKKV
jgi:amino acid transporter